MSLFSIAKVSEVPIGGKKKVVAQGKAFLLANIDGTFHALADKCPHLGGSLSDGLLDGSIVTCQNHGAKFDVVTGKSVGQAKILFMKMNVNDAKSYRVEIRQGEVFIELKE